MSGKSPNREVGGESFAGACLLRTFLRSALVLGRTIEWSDSGTNEDLVGATTAAVRRFEDQELEDR